MEFKKKLRRKKKEEGKIYYYSPFSPILFLSYIMLFYPFISYLIIIPNNFHYVPFVSYIANYICCYHNETFLIYYIYTPPPFSISPSFIHFSFNFITSIYSFIIYHEMYTHIYVYFNCVFLFTC